MIYAYIDGDDIGLKIENSFMNNDEDGLKNINNMVKDAVDTINNHLQQLGYELIFGGADGIICKGEDININELMNYVRNVRKELNFSIGLGMTLKDSYIALRYAKSNGKNIAAMYDGEFKLIK